MQDDSRFAAGWAPADLALQKQMANKSQGKVSLKDEGEKTEPAGHG